MRLRVNKQVPRRYANALFGCRFGCRFIFISPLQPLSLFTYDARILGNAGAKNRNVERKGFESRPVRNETAGTFAIARVSGGLRLGRCRWGCRFGPFAPLRPGQLQVRRSRAMCRTMRSYRSPVLKGMTAAMLSPWSNSSTSTK